jgi:hypothetical protein
LTIGPFDPDWIEYPNEESQRLSRKIVAESGSPEILIGWKSREDDFESSKDAEGSGASASSGNRASSLSGFIEHLVTNDHRPNLNGPATKKR